jgi:hypothetical protein
MRTISGKKSARCGLCFLFVFFLVALYSNAVFAQNTLTQIDSSMFFRDSIRPFLDRFDNIRFSGYIQTQFQATQADGARTYAGGDFQEGARTRFMMRRGRLRLDYLMLTPAGLPKVYFVFQFDGTERGVNIRDFWGKYYESKWNVLSLTTGVFARPFGFEVNWSSMVREAPERGRMSQILLQTERDIGAMVSFEPQQKGHPLQFLKVDVGLFNGQGLPGFADFDSRKDLISRVSIRPLKFAKKTQLSGSASYYIGGTRQFSPVVYQMGTTTSGIKSMLVDSALSNIGRYSPRRYGSVDAQLKIKSGWGDTEFRAEYWRGTQPGTAISSTSLPTIEEASLPRFNRPFDGAYFYFLQHLFNRKHQLVVKYDWYDPNRLVEGNEIRPGTNLGEGDIRFDTFGFGYLHYFNDHFKVVAFYEMVKNEFTQTPGFEVDLPDNVFTLRVQYKF